MKVTNFGFDDHYLSHYYRLVSVADEKMQSLHATSASSSCSTLNNLGYPLLSIIKKLFLKSMWVLIDS